MMGLNPVCVKCGRELTCAKNEVLVVHPFERPEPGPVVEKSEGFTLVNVDALFEGSWKDGDIDFIAQGDKYRCPGCGCEIVLGFSYRMDAFKFSQEHIKKIVAGYNGEDVIIITRKGP